MKNAYTILEIDINADKETIKAAFRKLAKRYHPDLNPHLNGDDTQFKEVKDAYDQLKNKNFKTTTQDNTKKSKSKKQDYDKTYWDRDHDDHYQYHYETNNTQENKQNHPNWGRKEEKDPFESFYESAKKHTENDIATNEKTHTVEINFTESIAGTYRIIRYQRYSGTVNIPPNVKNGEIIEIKNGLQDRNGNTIEAQVKIIIQKSPYDFYWREGNDLWAKFQINTGTLKTGLKTDITLPTGENITFKIPPNSTHETIITIPKKGFPHSLWKKGDLNIQLIP